MTTRLYLLAACLAMISYSRKQQDAEATAENMMSMKWDTWLPAWAATEHLKFEAVRLPGDPPLALGEQGYLERRKGWHHRKWTPDVPWFDPNVEPPLACEVVIVTSGTLPDDGAQNFRLNQINYARQFDYCVFHFTCDDTPWPRASPKSSCSKFHFWRYVALYRILMEFKFSEGRKPHWLMAIDTDVMFTDMHKSIDDLIKEVLTTGNPKDGSEISMEDVKLIIAADGWCHDPKIPLNSGVFLIRPDEIWKLYLPLLINRWRYREDLIKRGDRYFSSVLVDQPIITDFLQDAFELDYRMVTRSCEATRKLRPPISRRDVTRVLTVSENGEAVVASSRSFNSFKRSMNRDPRHLGWHRQDFIAHISGTKGSLRGKLSDTVCRMVEDTEVDEICPFKEKGADFGWRRWTLQRQREIELSNIDRWRREAETGADSD